MVRSLICCCLVPQVHEAVCHDTMSHIAGMIYIIKELILRQYSAFFSGQAKLRCNRILNADHGQFIGLTHNRKPILKIPVICKHCKKQYHRRMPRQCKNLTDQTFITYAFCLIAFIIHSKFYHYNIRLNSAISQYIPVKTQHSKL